MGPPLPSLFLQVEENPNCAPLDGLVFQPRTEPRAISKIRCAHQANIGWFDITGLNSGGEPCPATACLIDDSGEGACYLITGGEWGLRFYDPASDAVWGEPYLLVPADDEGLIFCPSTQS